MNLYERFGHKQEQLETALEEYAKTIGLLQKLKAGAVKLQQLVIKENGTWQVTEMPARAPSAKRTHPPGV